MHNTPKSPAKGTKPPMEFSPEAIERLSRLRFLKTDEVAAITRMSPKTIRKLCRLGKLKAVPGIRPLLIPASQLAKFEGNAA